MVKTGIFVQFSIFLCVQNPTQYSKEKTCLIGRRLYLLEELSKIVVVERKGPDQEGVQDHPARPDVRARPVVLLTLTE